MLFYDYRFIFLFLPSLFCLYSLTRWIYPRGCPLILLGGSILFYCQWQVKDVWLLLGSILLNYLLGEILRKHRSRKMLILGLVLNLGTLGYYKYSDFLLGNLSDLLIQRNPFESVALPLAISFFTFQQISYLLDIYRDQAEPMGPIDYGMFITFFPQLIAGPILRQDQMVDQISRSKYPDPLDGEQVLLDLSIGITFFVLGLFKKIILADSLAEFANPIFTQVSMGENITAVAAWVAALAYTLQLYFDFSGYCDMAIGLARAFGFKLPMNFQSPYKSLSIAEFWRRWHITLSHWLRDYLYIPLGGNRKHHYRNLMITMVLAGLWHGAGLTFLVWGVLQGLFLIIHHLWQGHPLSRWIQSHCPTGLLTLSCWLITFLSVVIAWVIFRAESLGDGTRLLSAMVLGWSGATEDLALVTEQLGWILIGLGIAVGLPNGPEWLSLYAPVLDPVSPPHSTSLRRYLWHPSPIFGLTLGSLWVWTLFSYWSLTTVPEFIYFNF